MTIDELSAAHADRLSTLDPLLSAPPLMPEESDVVLRAEVGGAHAAGLVVDQSSAPDAEAALWGPLRSCTLSVRVTGERRTTTVDQLLTRFDDHLRAIVPVGDDEVAAAVRWPARDLDGPRALVAHGYAALTTIAVRPRDRGAVLAHDAVVVRAAIDADLPALTGYAEALLRDDTPWGVLTERPGQRNRLAEALTTMLEAPGTAVLVAEVDGTVRGYLTVQSVEGSRWIGGCVAADPMRYLAATYVDPAVRSSGVGRSLVAAAHRILDQEGTAATLLHHALPSPVSTPFWARMGYRPLWTLWQRRPARR